MERLESSAARAKRAAVTEDPRRRCESVPRQPASVHRAAIRRDGLVSCARLLPPTLANYLYLCRRQLFKQ